MWVFIIVSILLAFGVARIIVGFQAQSIMSQWSKFRCNPDVMIWASMFKPSEDPRSEFQYTADNFTFCTSEIAKKTLEVIIKPLLDVFVKMIESSIVSIGYVMNLRALSSNLFHGLESIFNIFGRRFNLTVHEIHKTFIKQMSALEKTQGMAVSSLFAGLSMVKAIMNAFEFMIKVTISILLILVVMVVFFFFLLAPVIPLVLTTIAIIGTTAYAGSTGGMGEAFCFSEHTHIALVGGSKPIDSIKVDDILADGSTVTSVLKFKTYPNTVLYKIDNIIVSGSHLIYENGVAKFVRDVDYAEPCALVPEFLYCLNTSSHKIPVIGLKQTHIFADWEELDDTSMSVWSQFVYTQLNNTVGPDSSDDLLHSETGLSPDTRVLVKDVYNKTYNKSICDLVIGDQILDTDGWTTVNGLVTISKDETYVFTSYDEILMSGACWILDSSNLWTQVFDKGIKAELPVNNIVSIFTESGTFKINNTVFRDYSDVGLTNIEKSYKLTLSRLNQNTYTS